MGTVKLEYLQEKREEVLKTIGPMLDSFGIKDYDYIVKDTGQIECLRIEDVYIGCSLNSVDAVVEEVIGYLFVTFFCKNRYIGAFKTQTLNRVKENWLDETQIKDNYGR